MSLLFYYVNHLFVTLNDLQDDITFTKEVSFNELPFLDVKVIKKDSLIQTDVYYKPTHNFSFLHFDSNHPRHVKRSLPYSMLVRLNRIVSDIETKNKRKIEILSHFLRLRYPMKLLVDAFIKSNEYNFKHKSQKTTEKLTYVIPFSDQCISLNHKYINNIIKPLTDLPEGSEIRRAYKQTCSLHISLLNRIPFSFKVSKCARQRCKTCTIMIEYNDSIEINNRKFRINKNCTCTSKNVIYFIECVCGHRYVGQTTNEFHIRMNLHRNQIAHEEYTFLPITKHLRDCQGQYRCSIL